MKRFIRNVIFIRKISVIKTIYYSLKFKSKIFVGKGTVINLHRQSKIINTGVLFIGCDFSLPQKTVLDIYNNGTLKTDGIVKINNGTKIMIWKNAILSIGNGSYINEHSRVQCRKSIKIGENCAISWNVNILDTDEHEIIIDGKRKQKEKEVIIGNHVWIGCNCTILKGVNIGDGAVIGAGTVVTKDIKVKSLVVGNPYKIREGIDWE